MALPPTNAERSERLIGSYCVVCNRDFKPGQTVYFLESAQFLGAPENTGPMGDTMFSDIHQANSQTVCTKTCGRKALAELDK